MDIQNIFINVKGINRYRFTCFFHALERYRMKNGCNIDLGIWTLLGDYGTSLLNSICTNGGYMKQIHRRTRNKKVLIPIVFYCVLTENVRIWMKEAKYYGEITVSSLLTSICKIGGYTKHIHKRTRNKTVLICVVFYCVFQK